MKLVEFLKIILRGTSQVMLQNNLITGILFLIGIFYNSWLMGFGALIGNISGTTTALSLKYNKDDIAKGYYGFNGTLVGIALLFFYEANILTIIFIIIGSVLSSIFMNFMQEKRLSPFTFPFVLSTWILLFLINYFNLITLLSQSSSITANLDIFSSLSLGFGQVMFQASIITGILFFLGILVNSRSSSFFSFLGSLIGMLIALLFSFPLNLVNLGIFGFNEILCGIAFAKKEKYSILLAVVSIVLSVFIIYTMINFNLTYLTFPFVLATWITLIIRKYLIRI